MLEAIFVILIGFNAGYQLGESEGIEDGAIKAYKGEAVCVDVPQFNKPNEWQCVIENPRSIEAHKAAIDAMY